MPPVRKVLGGTVDVPSRWHHILHCRPDWHTLRLFDTQGGTDLDDVWQDAATSVWGSTVFVGYTSRNWTGAQSIREDNVSDFAAMAMSEDGLQLWTYQVISLGMSLSGMHSRRTKRCIYAQFLRSASKPGD